MKRRFLGSVAVLPVLFAGPAIAASPAMPAYNWTGFYVGANAGGTWARSEANTTTDCSSALVPPSYFCNSAGFGAANAAAVNAAGTGAITDSGFTGGIQAGYNWQAASLIFGLETDFDSFHLKSSRQSIGTYPTGFGAVPAGTPFSVNSSFATDWLYTLRGRVGVPVAPNLMGYATGGLAVTRLTVSDSFSDNVAPGAVENASQSKLKTGWTVGGGLEWALTNNWSVKAEYLYIDFGHVAATGTITNVVALGYSQGMSTSSDLTAHVARIGVNRKF
jgi:outer membrane immunogenic protein